MPRCNTWQGLDRLSFCENAILLDIKSRSQGKPIKARASHEDPEKTSVCNLPDQKIRHFLDDFALVASGNGGKDNVSAVCMEKSDQGEAIVLRVARNEGLSEEMILDLRRFLQGVTQNLSDASQIDRKSEDILLEVLRRCRGRLFKHIESFLNELRNAHCRPENQYGAPRYVSETGATETTKDLENLGIHGPGNHSLYMQVCRHRLTELRSLSTELTRPSNTSNFQQMMLLTKAAYDVRRSSSFRQYLKHNLQKTKNPSAMVPIVGSLLERLGKISRFYRAALTITMFGIELSKQNITIRVEAVPTTKVRIPELGECEPADLRRRGGVVFEFCSNTRLQEMIGRWPQYRLHSEIQLVVFYEENPHLELHSSYIGCDKLSCYLCYSFITQHDRFSVNGCHQSLYSLWTVPEIVSFESEKRADQFRKALQELGHDLEYKMMMLRQRHTSRHTWNNESVANLSRLSLPLPVNVVEAGPWQQTTEGNSIDGSQITKRTFAPTQKRLQQIPEDNSLDRVKDKQIDDANSERETPCLEQIPEDNSLNRVTDKIDDAVSERETPSLEQIPEDNSLDRVKDKTDDAVSDRETPSLEKIPEDNSLDRVKDKIDDAVSDRETPNLEDPGTEKPPEKKPEVKQHLQGRRRRRPGRRSHSHHGQSDYHLDPPRQGNVSSRHALRRRSVEVFTREARRSRQRRRAANQASRPSEQNWSSNRRRPRQRYRYESGSSRTKKSEADFLHSLWEFFGKMMVGCVSPRPPRRPKPAI